jgi:hypothetical protein
MENPDAVFAEQSEELSFNFREERTEIAKHKRKRRSP